MRSQLHLHPPGGKITNSGNKNNQDPFRGTGKPEALRGNLAGYWSRRITGEHRIVYKKVEGTNPDQILMSSEIRRELHHFITHSSAPPPDWR